MSAMLSREQAVEIQQAVKCTDLPQTMEQGIELLLADHDIWEKHSLTQLVMDNAALRAQLDTSMRTQEQLAENVNTGLLEIQQLKHQIASATAERDAMIKRLGAHSPLTDKELADPEYIKAYIESQEESYSIELKERQRLQARVIELEAALTPFAKRAEYFERNKPASGNDWPDDREYSDDPPTEIYIKQLRDAQVALKAKGGT